jgi:glycosyltransferase involved in cell wall biosynthesis
MTLVSVIIPAFNAGRHLLASVHSALRQNLESIEVIVIDDGSTDDSFAPLSCIKDARLRIVRQSNAGKSVALNRAIEISTGEFIAIQDADDLSYPDRFERQANALQVEVDLGAVFCGHDLLLNGRHIAPRHRAKRREVCHEDIRAMRMPAHDPTIMFRRSCAVGVLFDPELRIGQGFDFVLRLGEVHPMKVLGECLYSYRITARSATRRSVTARQAGVSRVLEKAQSRRGLPPAPSTSNASKVSNSDRDNDLATHFLESVTDLVRRGHRMEAFRTGLVCWRLHPFDPAYCRSAAAACLPHAILRRLRRSYS